MHKSLYKNRFSKISIFSPIYTASLKKKHSVLRTEALSIWKENSITVKRLEIVALCDITNGGLFFSLQNETNKRSKEQTCI